MRARENERVPIREIGADFSIGRSSSGPSRAHIVGALMNQIRQNASEGWVNGAAAEALATMDERSVGPELRALYAEGRIQNGVVRGAELLAWFERDG
jgi:hypothetical protein